MIIFGSPPEAPVVLLASALAYLGTLFPTKSCWTTRTASSILVMRQQKQHPRFFSESRPSRLALGGMLLVIVALGLWQDGQRYTRAFRSASVLIAFQQTAGGREKLPQRQPQPRKIFVDLGANCGNSYLKLRTTSPYWQQTNPSGTTTTTASDEQQQQQVPWDVYLWEANPQLVRLYLNDLASGSSSSANSNPYDTGTDRIHIVAAAATTQDTQLQFYLTQDQQQATTKDEFRNGQCDIHNGRNPSGASSLLSQARSVGHQHPVTVPALNFGHWLHQLGLGDDDRLLLKIDIEGAEVDLLQSVLDNYSDDFCRVERLWVEWHAFIFDDPILQAKHQSFAQRFPEQFRAVCGREVPLQGWH